MNLSELLGDLNLEVDDKGEGNKGDEKKIDLEKIPEDQRELVKTTLEEKDSKIGDLDTQVAQQGLTLKTMQESFEKATTEKVVEKKAEGEEKILGILAKDDLYAPVFQKLADSIDKITGTKEKDAQKDWLEELETFAEKNPEIAKYANDMDRISGLHPTLKTDLKLLFRLGKEVYESRETKKETARRLKENAEGAGKKELETTGISSSKTGPDQAKTIAEAFEKAQTQMSKI